MHWCRTGALHLPMAYQCWVHLFRFRLNGHVEAYYKRKFSWLYVCYPPYTVICEFSLLNFCFAQSDENSLAVLTYTVNNDVWHAFEIDENIITQKFLAQTFCE